MCGIAGIISDQPIDFGILMRMNASISHRGPNDEGYLSICNDSVECLSGIDTPDSVCITSSPYQPTRLIAPHNQNGATIGFAHRRLSICDLSPLGHQPMSSLNRRYWIVFNGEIYNHPELRCELEVKGYRFVSNSDTEVILAAFDFWGSECLGRFNGMWAFVIYDNQLKRIFISRDRFGKKPLYYINHKGAFYFASEMKAFAELVDFVLRPNVSYLNNYLLKGCEEWQIETAFEGVYRFASAAFFEGSVDKLINNFNVTQFWTLAPNASSERFDQSTANAYAEQYFKLLEDSVRIRLRSDVGVGSALSGGLDSSSIVYLVNKILKQRGVGELQKTFSSIYHTPGTQDCDESYYINILKHELQLDSSSIEAFEDDIPIELEKVIWAMDSPPESSCMSGWHTFKLVSRSGIRVTLDGQGADEQLGGYLRYVSYFLSELNFFDAIREAWYFRGIPGSRKAVVRGLFLSVLTNILGRASTEYLVFKLTGRKIALNLNAALASDLRTHLVTLLHYSDSVSMGYSIESRMPFLDYRLVEFLASIPSCYKIRFGWSKYIARLAFSGKLPDEICWRRDKLGWAIPDAYWFTGGLKTWFDSEEEYGRSYIRAIGLNVRVLSTNIYTRIRTVNLGIWSRLFGLSDKAQSGTGEKRKSVPVKTLQRD